MTENSRDRNLELGLFALAFGLALAIRLLRLGELPLTDEEARWALQAFDLSRGLRPEIGPQPAYVVLTAFSFFIVQAGNFAARLVPALFGAVLALVPFLFRQRLGYKPAIFLAFFLAIDPAYLALSRLAGGSVIAVTVLLLAWGAWRNRNWRAAGICIGLALLSGPQLWPGVLGLAVTYGFRLGFKGRFTQPEDVHPVDQHSMLTLLAYAGGSYLVLGSLFLLATGGLSAGLAAIPAYFGGWLTISDVPASRLLIGLVSYEYLALLLAIAGLVRGILRKDELVISMGIWLAVALVLALVYPSRQVADLAWVLIPILTLAAVELSAYFSPIQDGKWETIGMAIFTASVLVFAAINYSAIALVSADPVAMQIRWWLLLGSLALLAVSIAMVAFGWSVPTAVQGGLWGALLVLFILTLSTSIASGGLRTNRTAEMWPAGPNIGQADVLVSQMNELSRSKAGLNHSLDVTILSVDSPALRWILRDWPLKISSGNTLAGSTPSIVIASDQFNRAEIEATYRGRDLKWRTWPAWEQGLLSDWLRWTIRRDFPHIDENIVLWVRNDVFLDSQNIP